MCHPLSIVMCSMYRYGINIEQRGTFCTRAKDPKEDLKLRACGRERKGLKDLVPVCLFVYLFVCVYVCFLLTYPGFSGSYAAHVGLRPMAGFFRYY